MARLTHNTDFGDQGLLFQFDEIISQLNFMKSEYLWDSKANEYFDWLIIKILKIRMDSLKNPRYKWQIIQNDMDNLYRQGNGDISGYIINIGLNKNPKLLPGQLYYNISELKISA